MAQYIPPVQKAQLQNQQDAQDTADTASMMDMLSKMYGIQQQQQMAPEHLRALQLANAGQETQNRFIEPNAQAGIDAKLAESKYHEAAGAHLQHEDLGQLGPREMYQAWLMNKIPDDVMMKGNSLPPDVKAAMQSKQDADFRKKWAGLTEHAQVTPPDKWTPIETNDAIETAGPENFYGHLHSLYGTGPKPEKPFLKKVFESAAKVQAAMGQGRM